VSLCEERVCEGFAARRSLHASGQRPGSLLVLMPPFRPSSARRRASKTPRQHEALPHPHERSRRCATGDPPTADPSTCESLRRPPAATGASPTGATPSRLWSPGRKTAAPGAPSRGILAAVGPPLTPHRARLRRGTGARTRPRTPGGFVCWPTTKRPWRDSVRNGYILKRPTRTRRSGHPLSRSVVFQPRRDAAVRHSHRLWALGF